MRQDLGQSTETQGLRTKSPSLLLASRMYVEVGQTNREGTGLYSVLTSFWPSELLWDPHRKEHGEKRELDLQQRHGGPDENSVLNTKTEMAFCFV